MEAVNNLIATPLRIEPALTKDELLLVERGARKVGFLPRRVALFVC